MKKLLILLLFSITISTFVFAEDFLYNGIYYTILDEAQKTCEIRGETRVQDEDGDYIWVGGNPQAKGDVVIPSCVYKDNVEYTVTKLGNSAFNGTGIKSLILPNTIVEFGSKAVSECFLLEKIVCPNEVTSLGGPAFEYNRSLSSVQLPNKLDEISGHTFRSCYSLKKIAIPNSVRYINNYAFHDCVFLQELYIPESLVINIWSKFLYSSDTSQPSYRSLNKVYLAHTEKPFSESQITTFFPSTAKIYVPFGVKNLYSDELASRIEEIPFGISLVVSKDNLQPDQIDTLKVSKSPEILPIYDLKWTSNNPDVVEVDENGVVKAKQDGEALITVSGDYGPKKMTASCTIIVGEGYTTRLDDLRVSPDYEIWYNMQGERIKTPLKGNVYIHIMNGNASKVRY